jgi:hypothetical protein
MTASRPSLRALAVGAGAVALVVVGVGGTVAASNPATLYACYNTSGQVAMSDVAQCKLTGGGRLVSWGTQPVPGPTGPQGATGAQGPTGPTGPRGPVARMQTATGPGFGPGFPLALGIHTVSAGSCPTGTGVVGGWGSFQSNDLADYAKVTLVSSGPRQIDLSQPTEWSVTWYVSAPLTGTGNLVAALFCS